MVSLGNPCAALALDEKEKRKNVKKRRRVGMKRGNG